MWHSDQAWVEAAEAASRLAGHHFRSFGPQEFSPFIEGMLPLEYSECSDDVTFFVCPKDDVDLLSSKVTDRLGEFTCVFANAVFVAYSSAPEDRAAQASKAAMESHLPYFLDKLRKMKAGQPIRRSRLNPRHVAGDFSRAKKGKRILIVNASGMGNMGDELLTEATIKLCREIIPDAEICITEPTVDRSLIAKADHIVLGAAGTLYEFASNSSTADLRNIANYFKFGYYAQQYGSSFTVLGLGHQQVNGRFVTSAGPRFVRGALRHAAAVTTRDANTFDMLRDLLPEADHGKLHSSEDPSFAFLSVKPPKTGEIRHVTFVGGRLASAPATRTMIRALYDEGCRIRIVLQANEDPILAQMVERDLRDVPIEVLDLRPLSVTDCITAFQETDAVVTARFHSLAIAVAGGLPVLALDHPMGKKERLIRRLHGEDWSEVLFRREETDDAARARIAALLSGRLPRPDPALVRDVVEVAKRNADILKAAWTPVET